MDFLEELKWRGMIHTSTPNIHEAFSKPTAGYIGFDPTAPSLHIGSLATIMLLVHLQRAGHTAVTLIGGATAMIGDPSGKSTERSFLSDLDVRTNAIHIKNQLSRFLDFTDDKAIVINNLQWFGEMSVLKFLRDVGKHFSTSAMLAKDSVKNRLEDGISFTEFSYQLLQGYDFYTLFKEWDVTVQLGGSDQWGNMTSGIELIRKKESKKAHALTMPLLTKPDGSKFGKSEGGNIWLDRELTSPFQFYQYWLNVPDAECPKLLRLFTLLSEIEIELTEVLHNKAPHQRLMQYTLAKDITTRVHSAEEMELAHSISILLYGKPDIASVTEAMWAVVSTVIPTHEVSTTELEQDYAAALVRVGIFASKGDVKRMMQQNGLKVNGVSNKIELAVLQPFYGKYLYIQKGKVASLLVVQHDS